MGALTDILVSAVGSVLGRQVYDSAPKLSAWIIRKAARRLPTAEHRVRREEEWLAHLADEPGLAGLRHAVGAVVASVRMSVPFGPTTSKATWSVYLRVLELNLFVHVKAGKNIAEILTETDAEKHRVQIERMRDGIALLVDDMEWSRKTRHKIWQDHKRLALKAPLWELPQLLPEFFVTLFGLGWSTLRIRRQRIRLRKIAELELRIASLEEGLGIIEGREDARSH